MKDDEWKKLLEIVNSFDKWYPLHGVIEYSPEITGAAARKGGILFVEIQKIAPGQLELILHIKDKDRDENLTRRVTPSYLPDAKSDLFARLEQIMEALRQECDREQSVKEKDIISEALEIARNQK